MNGGRISIKQHRKAVFDVSHSGCEAVAHTAGDIDKGRVAHQSAVASPAFNAAKALMNLYLRRVDPDREAYRVIWKRDADDKLEIGSVGIQFRGGGARWTWAIDKRASRALRPAPRRDGRATLTRSQRSSLAC